METEPDLHDSAFDQPNNISVKDSLTSNQKYNTLNNNNYNNSHLNN
jgi:hypothetical protein